MIPDPWWKRNPDGDAAESARRRYGDEYDIAYWNGGGIKEDEDDDDLCDRQED